MRSFITKSLIFSTLFAMSTQVVTAAEQHSKTIEAKTMVKSHSTMETSNKNKVETKLPMVVVVKASWCPACTKIDPAFKKVMKHYKGKAQFVVLDVSDSKSVKATQEKVKNLGLDAFYKAYGSRTSTVAILHPDTKKVFKVFMAESRVAKYEQALNKALKSI